MPDTRAKGARYADTRVRIIARPKASSSVWPVAMRIMQTSTRLQIYWPPGLGLLDVEGRSLWRPL